MPKKTIRIQDEGGDGDVILLHIYASRFFAAMLYARRREMFMTAVLLKYALLVS